MARRGRQRDHNTIANTHPHRVAAPTLNRAFGHPVSRVDLSPLTDVQDLRTWHPDPIHRRQAFKSGRVGARIINPAGDRLSWRRPARLAVCVRRQERKEVLHALRRTGKGARSPRRRRTWLSSVSCRG